MPLYMSQFAYTPQSWAALVKNPEDRRATVSALAEKAGCRVVEMYYCFGEYDGVLLTEAPDETTVMSLLMTIAAAGHLKALKTTTLFTVEDTLKALGKAGGLAYRGPRG